MRGETRQKAAIIGGGVIGGGWAARFVLNGWDVAVFDPDARAERRTRAVLANARRALPALYDRCLPEEGDLAFVSSLQDAVSGADWIQENVPEWLELKQTLLAKIEQVADPAALIGSSTSGFKPSQLNTQGGRAFVAHPFNPVYLLPLVELVGAPGACESAATVLRAIGMAPLIVRKEIDAHIADRLLEAVWRESLWLVSDGVATTEEIDEAIRLGFGLRWAQMGLFETYRIAGGEDGMRHFLTQFGPALSWPWTHLRDVPEFTDHLVDMIVDQSEAQSGHLSIGDLERLRDDNLVGIIRSLRKTGQGAGAVVRDHEETLDLDGLFNGMPVTGRRQIPATWVDYNGHMNETHYLEVGSQATDAFMEMIGADEAYIAEGLSFFTAETHIRHLDEVMIGDTVTVTTQVISAEGKKMLLFHRLWRSDGILAATVETLQLHMDLNARKTCLPGPRVAERLASFAIAHAGVPAEGQGRFVGQRRP